MYSWAFFSKNTEKKSKGKNIRDGTSAGKTRRFFCAEKCLRAILLLMFIYF